MAATVAGQSRIGTRHGLRLAIGLAVVAAALTQPAPASASASEVVTPVAAVLSDSATCRQGDIEIVYDGIDVARQVTTFTAAGQAISLHAYDVHTYSRRHTGTEHILSQTRNPPPVGTVVAVHVTIGSSPPQPGVTGEFFVAWRCDSVPNSAGGANTVVQTCAGFYGDCPRTASDANAGPVIVPTFTG